MTLFKETHNNSNSIKILQLWDTELSNSLTTPLPQVRHLIVDRCYCLWTYSVELWAIHTHVMYEVGIPVCYRSKGSPCIWPISSFHRAPCAPHCPGTWLTKFELWQLWAISWSANGRFGFEDSWFPSGPFTGYQWSAQSPAATCSWGIYNGWNRGWATASLNSCNNLVHLQAWKNHSNPADLCQKWHRFPNGSSEWNSVRCLTNKGKCEAGKCTHTIITVL